MEGYEMPQETPRYRKYFYGFFVFVGLFTVGIGAGYILEHNNEKQQAAAVAALENETQKNEMQSDAPTISHLETNALPEIKLTFTGDITLNSTIKKNVKAKLDGDYTKIFGAATPILQKSDVTFGTFNGTFGINDSNRADTKAAIALRDTGFDIVGTSFAGTNRTIKNLIETTLVIDGNGLIHVGAGRSYQNAREPKLIEKNGVTVGYLAFTDNATDWPLATDADAGMLWANDPQIEEIIATAKAKSDVLVVSFNWADKATSHTLRQELLAKTAIDAGATIVTGHFGSNLHDIEYYHGGIIAYNLGKLISGNGTKPSGIQGLIFETGIRGGVINTVAAYGVIENQNGFIDSVSPVSMESLIREKGVVNNAPPEEIIKSLPASVTSEVVTHGTNTAIVNKKVAITIDDGWSAPLVKRALDILSTKSAKATFFTVGSVTDANRLNIIRAVTNGIEIGNHTDTHGWLTQMSDAQMVTELTNWQTKIDAALGMHYTANWFRPPFMAGFAGHTKTAERITAIAKEKGMKVALWSIDPFSGISLRADAPAVTNYIVDNTKPGDIILLHFTPEHMEALPGIIDGLRAKGYELVTLTDLMQDN